ncbi:hypothetical protein CHELA41_51255 [Hyphomicrobiales bacterium]|nr:hypothetical protein CHELA41_51255 [Hyphomicrobiales bacterium]
MNSVRLSVSEAPRSGGESLHPKAVSGAPVIFRPFVIALRAEQIGHLDDAQLLTPTMATAGFLQPRLPP